MSSLPIALPAPRTPPWRPCASSDTLLLLASAFWALALNRPFLAAASHGHPPGEPASWAFGAALLLALVCLHALLLGLVATRRTVKPLLALLSLVGAVALHYMQAFGSVIDPSMLRNVLHTDIAESRELLSWGLALDLLLYAALPIVLLASVKVRPRPWSEALRMRALLLLVATGGLALALGWQFQPIAAMTRNHKEVRYLVTPANVLWSLGSVLASEARGAAKPRQPIGLDAKAGPSWGLRERPRLVVLVVGETARAANWGLSGYARQTTPQLAQLPGLINLRDVTACGTSTEVSLPCMFAPVGRRDYDEARIRGSQSLLHVLARAGAQVHWRDNQSGCKGVCEGLAQETVDAALAPGQCQDGRCQDEALLRGLDERLRTLAAGGPRGTQLLVLHMLGSHGPSYFRRYPAPFERFTPACRHDDLAQCTPEQIVNAYDNSLLYTDHVLATLAGTLAAHAPQVDAAMLYVSDHGESLGEHRLYLHGVPYPVAPREQTQVPMVMWFSPGWQRADQLDAGCLRRRAAQAAQHDHLFHTVLGLLDVHTALYDPALDLVSGCRSAP